jgi:hypothetical protein
MFKPIIHNSFESSDQAVCDAPRVGLLSNLVNNQIRTAFRHNYRVTDEEASALQGMFDRQLVLMNDDENAGYKNSSHPILSVLQEYANHDASDQIKALRRDGFRTMTIGDSLNKPLNADHNCLLLSSDREAFRYVNNAANKTGIEQQTIKNAAIHPKQKCNYCLDGAQKCHFQAPFCFAVHSTYDITPEQLYAIFANHGIEKMTVYCYIPVHVYDRTLSFLDEKQGYYKLWEREDVLIFTMGDYSINYEHSYKNWVKWAKFTRIIGPDFNIIKEHSRNIGPMHVLTLARTGKFGGPLSFCVPLSTIYGNYYRVPSVQHIFNNLATLKQGDVYHHLVPKHVYDTLLSYAIRASDEGYKFNELATLASGLLRSIKIGPVTYQDRWQVSANDYNDILMSIFFIGALKRTERTQGISYLFKHIKSWQGTFPVFYKIRNYFIQAEVQLFKHLGFGVGLNQDQWNRNAEERFYNEVVWKFDVVEIEDILIRCDIVVHHDPILKTMKQPKIEGNTVVKIAQEEINLIATQTRYNEMVRDFKKPSQWFHGLDSMPEEEQTHEELTFLLDAEITTPVEEQSDLKNDLAIKNQNTPASFLTGHCAIKAVWETFADHKRPKQRDLIFAVYQRMVQIIEEKNIEVYKQITLQQVLSYIMAGNWSDNDCSMLALDCCAMIYNLTINIMTHADNSPTVKVGIGKEPITIYYNNNHYSSLRGGARDKFDTLISKMEEFFGPFSTAIEVSCAPGNLVCKLAKKRITTHGCHYTPGIPMDKKLDFASLDDLNITVYQKIEEVNEYLTDIKYDVIICDAADRFNSERIISNIVRNLKFEVGTNFVVKSFGNIDAIYELATKFADVIVHDTGVGTERYFLMKMCNSHAAISYDEIFNKYGLRETTHLIPFNYQSTIEFAKTHFIGAFAKYKEYFKHDKNCFQAKGKNYGITIKAITGYPSASKTTDCVSKHPNAVYVSPSKNLAIKHNKLGVASFTPHTIFEEISCHPDRYQEIVIDEISQFPIEFISMMHIIAPDKPIIVLGDVYQIPHVNYFNNKKYKTVKDFGVVNNIHSVYKIPIDITKYINDKFKYHMHTKSEVSDGLCIFNGAIEQLKKYKFIAFNDATVKELKQKGFDASTITTYAGDRQPVIVLYIDGKSVLSQLNNRPEWIYTAMTRATDKLIITGDGPYLTKYLNLNHTNIESYTDINMIKFRHEMFIEKIENDKAFISVKQQDIIVKSLPVSVDVAVQVCSDHITPVNEATLSTMFTQPVELPAVEKGTLRVNLDTLLHKHRVFKGSKLVPNVAFVKNQISNDTKETTRCLIKRYSKNLPKMSEKRTLITSNLLIEALTKAIYGNKDKVRTFEKDMYVTEAEMLKYGIEYLESLQKKLNKSPELIKELQEEFNEYQETLTFVMKKQSKFDPTVGFDASDKVGQGVAAMSKKVNILMGAYARAILDKVRKLTEINGKKIIFATHDSDSGLNDLYTAVRQTCAQDARWLLNDFKEWDSTFRKCMTYVTQWLLIAVGCPVWLASWFTANRSKWNMLFFNKMGVTSLKGEEKQFSGNPFTICENTICNVALIYLLYDFKNEQMAIFKGDDSAVLCEDAKFTAMGQLIVNETGHQLKPHITHNGEFAGYALTKHGLFPDVLRFSCKFLGKIYTDQEHFSEVVQSVQERCSVVKNEVQKREGAIIIANHYADIGLKPEEALILFDFLCGSRNIKYNMLTPVQLPIASN